MFNEYVFRQRLQNAQDQIRRVLSVNKAAALQVADAVPHQYSDKYLLAEQLANCAVSATLNALLALGVTDEQLRQVVSWSAESSVTLALRILRTCVFVKQTERDEQDPNRVEVERTGFLASKTTVRTVTRITEFHYDFGVSYELRAYRGVGDAEQDSLLVLKRDAQQSCVVRSKVSPYPETTEWRREVSVDWLLRHVTVSERDAGTGTGEGVGAQVQFRIDRAKDDCWTPRRNKEVDGALDGFAQLNAWCADAAGAFAESLWRVQYDHGNEKDRPDMSLLESDSVFVPVVAMFEKASSADKIGETETETETAVARRALVVPEDSLGRATATATATAEHAVAVQGDSQGAVALRATTTAALVGEQRRSLESKFSSLDSAFSAASTRLISVVEAKLVVALRHVCDVAQRFGEGVDFVEDMVRKQLIAAVGKELTPADLSEYMGFHYRKLLKPQFQPRPLSHAVRRTAQHSPEGTVRIEAAGESSGSGATGSNKDPILAFSHCVRQSSEAAAIASALLENGAAEHDADYLSVNPPRTMEFALDASTTVRFRGDVHVHGWLGHRFSDSAAPSLQLVAETRQFSSFVVLVGRIASATTFDPKHAFIVQNKDLVVLPLLLETLPTPKEFRDAIESLSPEQQRFAKAFRAMQLESTLFAVCVVQIKPQLEQLLRLQADSLTKEIRLTQDLLRLFIEFQMPSDLLSFDGPDSASGAERLAAVKGHVQAMQSMLEQKKNEELAEKNREREFEEGRRRQIELDMAQLLEQQNSFLSTQQQPFDNAELPRATKGGGGGIMRRLSASSSAVSAAPRKMKEEHRSEAPLAPLKDVKMKKSAMPSTSGVAVQPKKLRDEAQKIVTVSKPSGAKKSDQNDSKQEKKEKETEKEKDQEIPKDDSAPSDNLDLTKLPSLLDQQYDKLDSSHALRPTIIKVGPTWTKTSQKTLLGSATSTTMSGDEQDKEKRAAFDLLDALSRSGGLVLENVSLHVVIAATQSFDDTLMQCLVRKNTNPIERVERSALIMSGVLHGVGARELVAENHVSRLLALEGKAGKMFDEE